MKIQLVMARIATLSLAVAGIAPHQSRADFVVSVANVTATPGSTGSFDVIAMNTNAAGGASYGIAADVLEIQLVGTTGVTFAGASIATAATYVFPDSLTSLGVPFSTGPFPTTDLTVSDSDIETTSPYERLIAPGQIYGLAHVTYQVAPDATAGTISIVAARTSFADADGNDVSYTVANGSFRIATAVPAPPALALLASGLGFARFGALASRVRSRRSARIGGGR